MKRSTTGIICALGLSVLTGTSATAASHGGHGATGAAPSTGQFVAPRLVTTVATGSQEVGVVGDADGTATVQVVLIPSQNRACIIALARNVSLPATLVHIHNAPAGSNGPVAIDFTSVARQNAIAGVITGCVENANVTAIAQDPSKYYVNLHTADFPKGAVRGQLS
jgi:hypothetical protein